MFGDRWEDPSNLEKTAKRAGDVVSNIPNTATGQHQGQSFEMIEKNSRNSSGDVSGADGNNSNKSSSSTSSAGDEKPDWTLPIIIGLCTLITLILVLVGSGGEPAQNSPKAIVFVISGLKGTEFMNAVVDGPYAPNMRRVCQTGSFAACLHADDGRCCRTQDGPHFGPDYTFGSAPGIASILTGVNSNKHRVNNDSFDAMNKFSQSSSSYPSILKLAKQKGFSTGVVGSKNMLSTLGNNGRCSEFGILDFECGPEAISRCLARTSCNSDMRVALPPSFEINDLAPSGASVEEYSRGSELVETDMGKISEITNDAVNFINAGTDLIVIHINALELASNNAAEGGDYSVESKLSMAKLYMIDSVVGQIKSIVGRRVGQSRENWLVLGVSDHGGYNSTYGKTMDEDELVALFGSTYTLAGHLTLRQPYAPVRQYDVAPTVLRWMGLDALAANMDGKSQMICSNGINVANCTEEDTLMMP